MPRSRTSFKPGQPGGPGRPKGSKDRVPRGSIKAAFVEVIEADPSLISEAIRRGLQGRNALGYLDLGAKLLKEIGSGTEAGAPRIILVPGLDVDAFGRAPSRKVAGTTR